MSEEILNIEYHVKRMIVKALNNTQTHEDAALLLGITVRTLYRYKAQYNVFYDKRSNDYFLRESLTTVLKY